jgi:phage-related protein
MAVRTDAEFLTKLTAKDSLSPALSSVTSLADNTLKSLDRLGLSIITLNQAWELGKKAVEALIGPIETVLDAYAEAEKANARLANSLRLQGQYTKEAMQGFTAFAREMQRTTMAEDDQVLGMLATAKAMGVTDEMAKKMVQTAIDLAGAMGTDVQSAFADIQGTLAGMARGVSKVVPELRLLTQEELRAGKGVDMLAERLAGSGERATKTMIGMAAQTRNAWADVLEELGGLLRDAFRLPGSDASGVVGMLGDIRDAIESLREPAKAMRIEMQAFFGGMREGLASVDWKGLADSMKVAAVAAGVLLLAMQGSLALGAVVYFGDLALTVGKAALAYGKLALSASFAALKVGLVAAGIMTTVVGIDLFVRNLSRLDQLFTLFFTHVIGGLTVIAQAFTKLLGMDKLTASLEKGMEQLAIKAEAAKDGMDWGIAGKAMEQLKTFMDGFQKGADGTADSLKKAADAAEKYGNVAGSALRGLRPLTEENRKQLDDIIKKTEDLQLKAQMRGLSEAQAAQVELRAMLDKADALEKAIKLQKAMTPAILAQIDAYREAAKSDASARMFDAQKKALQEVTEMVRKYQFSMASAFSDLTGIGGEVTGIWEAQSKAMDEIAEKRNAMKEAGTMTPEAEQKLQGAESDVRNKAILGYLKAGASYIGAAISKGAEAIAGVMSGKYLDYLSSIIETIANLPDTLMKAFDRLDVAIGSLIEKLPGMLDNFLTKLPSLIDKIVAAIPRLVQGILDAIPKLVDGLVKAIPKLVDALLKAMPAITKSMSEQIPKIMGMLLDQLPKIFNKLPEIIQPLIDMIPKMFEQLMAKLPEIIESLLGALGKIIGSIIRIIPTLIVTLFQRLPDIIEKFISGFIGAIGEIVAAIIDAFIVKGGIFKIVGAFIMMIPRIVWAIVNGVAIGIKKFFQAFSFKGTKFIEGAKQIPKDFEKAASKLGKAIVRDTSQLFKVSELTQAVRGTDLADRIRDSINGAVEGFTIKIQGVWQAIMDLFKKAWLWVRDEIFAPIGRWLRSAWQFVLDFFYSFAALIKSAWEDILNFFRNFRQVINDGWQGVKDFFSGLANAFYDLGNQLWLGLRNGMVSGLMAVFEGLMKPLRDLWNTMTNWKLPSFPTFSWPKFPKFTWPEIPAPGWLKDIGGGGGGGGKAWYDPSGWSLASGGMVESLTRYLEQGGMTYAADGYFKPKGTDTVPAMLTPGEFVVSRQPAQANAGLLAAINGSRGPLQTGGGSLVLNVTINAKTNLTPDQVRTEVVPVIERALKRKSLDGGFVLASSGVRA